MLVHLDSFDSYAASADLGLEYTTAGSYAIATTWGRFGGGCFNALSGGGSLTRSLPATTSEIWTGFATKFSSTIGSRLFAFLSAAGVELSLIPTTTTLFVNVGAGTPVAVPIPNNFFASTWHWLEFRYKYHASAGIFEMWIDGVQVISYSGNTAGAGGGSITSVQLGYSSNGCVGQYDDWYIIDVAAGGANTTRLGDCRIGTLVPTSNASPNQATPSTGSAYTCVDEAQYNTTDYVTFSSYSAGKVEAYGMSSLPSTPIGIFGVRVLAIGDKSDAGSAGFYPYIASSGSAALGTGQSLSTSWGHIYSIFETDPHTSAAWATAAVNAMACGVQTV